MPPVTPPRKKLEENALVPRSNQDEEKEEEEKAEEEKDEPIDPNTQPHVVQFSLSMRDLTLAAFTDEKKVCFHPLGRALAELIAITTTSDRHHRRSSSSKTLRTPSAAEHSEIVDWRGAHVPVR